MTDKLQKKEVALVLSSGGARGLAHIGAIEELIANGYKISSIAGCSMGALIGGVYAAGKLDEFREWMKTIDRKKMLGLIDFSLSLNHLAKGKRIIEAIMEFVPDVAIEDLPIPYCTVATDLKAGKEVVFNKGSLFEAIRASISLPSFYEPVQRDGMILIDGGVINPIPLNRVKRHAGDILVGVDVSGHDYKSQWEEMHRLTEWQKNEKSLKAKILDKLIPDNIEFNYITLITRTSSLMIRQKLKISYNLNQIKDYETKQTIHFDHAPDGIDNSHVRNGNRTRGAAKSPTGDERKDLAYGQKSAVTCKGEWFLHQ